jgi:hypothetical protein
MQNWLIIKSLKLSLSLVFKIHIKISVFLHFFILNITACPILCLFVCLKKCIWEGKMKWWLTARAEGKQHGKSIKKRRCRYENAKSGKCWRYTRNSFTRKPKREHALIQDWPKSKLWWVTEFVTDSLEGRTWVYIHWKKGGLNYLESRYL